MKRILALCIFVLSSLMAFAELYTPHRYVELGIDTQAGSSNNYFRIDDVFKKICPAAVLNLTFTQKTDCS